MSFFDNPSDSWDKLKSGSKHFTAPVQFQNDFQYDGVFDEAIRKVLRLYATNKEVKNSTPNLRLYVENEVANLEHFFTPDKAIQPDETVQNWGKRIFEGKKYILVVNSVERFSDHLTHQFTKLMLPRLKNIPSEEVSFRITLFIGNSGFTPFGAHIDLQGLDVVHFHLGPGSKSMFLWEESKFQELNQSKEKHCYNYEPYLPNAKEFKLKSGDVLSFPADKYYHVGEYHEFSIAAAVGILKETPKSFFSKAMSTWKNDNHQQIPNKRVNSDSLFQRIPEGIRSQSIQDILEEYTCKKRSNSYMHHRPILKKLIPLFIIGKEVKLNTPFHIIVKDDIVYARGRKWDSPLTPETRLLLQKLVEKDFITCTKEMSQDTLGFVTWLFNVGSITFTKTISS